MRQSRFRVDLLAWRPLRALVASPLFPVSFQVMALALVLALAVNGFGQGLELGASELMLFRKTNLTTLGVWGLWWPSMVVAALLVGRVWCTVCPLELVHRGGDALARRFGWPRARLGKLLRAGWVIVALYLTLQLLVAGCSLHRVPHYTALLLIALLGLAFLTGLVFSHPRAFCSAFCPAGALLSVYSRSTPLQLEVHDPAVCERCTTKDCVRGERRYRFDKRSCPSLIRPYRRAPSDGCVLCLQCVKVCPHDNISLGVTDRAAPVRRKALLKPFEAAFVMIVFGFVTHEVVGEARGLDPLFHFIPKQLAALAPGVPFGWFEALWFLVLFPLIIWGLIAGVARLAGHRAGWRALLLAVATGAAPVVAVAHFAKGTAKLASWAGYLPGALAEPSGVETFARISAHTEAKPEHLVGLSLIGALALLVTALIAWRAFGWVRDIPATSKRAAYSGLIGTATLFSALLALWAWRG